MADQVIYGDNFYNVTCSFIQIIYPFCPQKCKFKIIALSLSQFSSSTMNSTYTTRLQEMSATTPMPDPEEYIRYSSPVNLTLAVYIVIQNSMIIYHYYKDWKRLSSCLFILIAAVDIGSACCAMVLGSVALLCVNRSSLNMQIWLFPALSSFGPLCYSTSAFFGMVLTVVKTINIINPFYRIRVRSLMMFLIILSFLGLILSVGDTWTLYTLINPKKKYVQCNISGGPPIYFMEVFVGSQIVFTYISPYLNQLIIGLILVFLEYCLPCLIVLVCMVLQIVYVKKTLRKSADPRQRSANEVTITILIISLLYFISFSVYSCMSISEFFYTGNSTTTAFKIYDKIFMIAKYTLPLVNPALFPTILILRKPDLWATYKGYMWTVIFLPVTLFHKVCQCRRGYTEI